MALVLAELVVCKVNQDSYQGMFWGLTGKNISENGTKTFIWFLCESVKFCQFYSTATWF